MGVTLSVAIFWISLCNIDEIESRIVVGLSSGLNVHAHEGEGQGRERKVWSRIARAARFRLLRIAEDIER